MRLPPPGHSDPGDPDNDAELEIESVTLNGCDVDPHSIKIARMKLIPARLTSARYWVAARWEPEWFLLTDLLREAAWEQAEREAA